MTEPEYAEPKPTPTETPAFPPLPSKIATALVAVMAGIEKLKKDENNPHANYMYAGIEAYLEMVRPLHAEHGLIVLQDEVGYEIFHGKDKYGKELAWLIMTFLFGLAHSSGETWQHRIKRTAMVQASMGSQAFGAAQSYALKSFLRALELIATGDTPDADSHEQRELPVSESVSNVTLGGGPTLPKKQSRAIYDELVMEMRALTDRDALRKWWMESGPRRRTMHPDFQRWLLKDAENHETTIETGANEEGKTVGEKIDDEIPEPGASG